MNNYDKDIIDYLVENHICATKEDAELYMFHMDNKKALDAYLTWNGIIGYTNTIMDIIADYTPQKTTFIVCTAKKSVMFRSVKAYKAYVARQTKKLESQGMKAKIEYKEERGLGWVDVFTIISVEKIVINK